MNRGRHSVTGGIDSARVVTIAAWSRARYELGIHPEGARALAASSCAEITDPDFQEESAECNAWLAAHPH